MTRRDHGILAALALAGTVVALWQCWYVSLPPTEAALIDYCRMPHLDCFESLQPFGLDVLPALAALAGCYGFMLALCALAAVGEPARRDAWLGLARLAAFPAAGLAIYLLLNDYMVAKTTSPSALLLGVIGLVLVALTVWAGLGGAKLKEGAGTAAWVAGAAVLFAFFVNGAVGARREAARVEMEGQQAPPQVRWTDFEPDIPRAGAAWLGNPLAPVEVLLFVDPRQEASRQLMREALRLRAPDVLFFFYAPGDEGARLMLAHRRGALEAFLAEPGSSTEPGDDLEPLRAEVARQAAAAHVTEYPTVIWKGGRITGKIDLASILAAAR